MEQITCRSAEAKDELGSYKQTCLDLTQMLMKQMERAERAESEAHNLRVELMDREHRISELERRIGWLENRGSDMSLSSGSPFADKNLY